MLTIRRTGLAAAAALCLALSGCSGSSGEEPNADIGETAVSKSDVKCGLGNGKKATGAPIQIGAIATMSGGIDFSSAPDTARAFFACVNANGGINGRPIRYRALDDGLNPQKSGQLAARLADDRDIVALAGDATFVGCGVAQPIYEKANLYDVNAVGVPRQCFESPNIAPVNAGPRISAIAGIQYFHEQGKAQRIAQNGNKTPGAGDWTQDGVRAYAKANGLKVVKSILHDPGIKDANSLILAFEDADPTVLSLVDPAPDDVAMLKAAERQNLKDEITFVCATPCYDTAFPAQVGDYWDGFVSNSEFTLLDAKTPDNRLWRQVLDAYGTKEQPRDSFSQGGFLAAKILTDTLLKLKPDEITRETASKAILGIKNYRTDILCAPWYFGESDRHNANHATRMVKIQDGKYVQAGGCQEVEDPDLGEIRRLERELGLVG